MSQENKQPFPFDPNGPSLYEKALDEYPELLQDSLKAGQEMFFPHTEPSEPATEPKVLDSLSDRYGLQYELKPGHEHELIYMNKDLVDQIVDITKPKDQ